jgi:hypothetical protein
MRLTADFIFVQCPLDALFSGPAPVAPCPASSNFAEPAIDKRPQPFEEPVDSRRATADNGSPSIDYRFARSRTHHKHLRPGCDACYQMSNPVHKDECE